MDMAFTGKGFDSMKYKNTECRAAANKWADQAWMLSTILSIAAASYGLTQLLAYALY